ncbi:MAG: plasmid recombination protein [Thermoanaerobacteraceae bacterium]|nr:plasmid recombination protein [Thermoanaerobacteraceae bacterium]
MSYAVIHMQKFKIGGVRGIQNHNERLKKSRTNPDIDYDKSKLNKKLDDQPADKTYYNRIRDRIKELELPKAVRKDAVVMCGFVCTSDKKFFEKLSQDQQDKFFQESYNFLKNRYGEKNIIAANVHYDETTPHMHCYIVPVTPDGRLSAKDLFTPTKLKQLQTEYHQHMKNLGFDLERGKSSDREHLSVQEFKLAAKKSELEREIKKINSSLTRLKSLKNDLKEYGNIINTLDQIGASTGFLKGKMKVSKDELNYLKSLAKKSIVQEYELKKLQELTKDMPKLQKAYGRLQEQNFTLQQKNRNLEAQLQNEQNKNQLMRNVIKQHGLEPELERAMKQRVNEKSLDLDLER